VGFFANRTLKKVSISGGAPVELVTGVDIQSASWGANDEIIFAVNSGAGLWRVSAGGGAPRAVTTLDPKKDEAAHAWPEVLPGGRAVLFSVRPASGSWDDAEIVVVSLDTGEQRVLIRGGSQAKYASSGHLVYASGGTLMAAPFDLNGLAVTGPPAAILQGLWFHRGQAGHAAQFAFAEAGSLVYLTGPEASDLAKLVWVDRAGKSQPLAAAPRVYQWPRLSPDGQKIAVVIQDPSDTDLWVFDVMRETSTRVTFHEQTDFPIWMPDGKRLTYHSLGRGNTNLVSKAADGSGIEEQLMSSQHQQAAESWSPDGRALVFQELAESQDLWVLPMDGDRKPRPFLRTPFEEGWARLSPDGRWLAYVSNESGRSEVYALPYPGPGGKRQLSNDGGAEPVWARNGRELFYRSGDKMIAVEVSTSPSFTAGKPRVLFEKPYIRVSSTPNYDVADDGRFLMLEAVDQQAAPAQLNVELNWFEELKRRVPTK
jgi:serine/threonine-protein kinase